MNKKRVLVTGGGGFIGSHLTDRLIHDGHDVAVLDNEITGCQENVNSAALYVRGDVTNWDCLEAVFAQSFDAVFHVAGQASTFKSFISPEEDLRTNVFGAINVIKMCIKHHVPRLLYASSMTVYGNPNLIPTPESELCKPISYYGITKYAAERYIHATAARNDLGFDFNTTSFRMFNVYGERQSLANPYQGVVGIFIGNILRGEQITIHSDGEQTRDFIYIRDVVDAWMFALDCPAAFGQVFNLGSGISCSINYLVDAIRSVAKGVTANSKIQYEKVRPGDQRYMTADIKKVQTALNWAPRVSLKNGMENTIRWALSNSELHK